MERRVAALSPIAVVYSITPLGRALDHQGDLSEAQRRFDIHPCVIGGRGHDEWERPLTSVACCSEVVYATGDVDRIHRRRCFRQAALLASDHS
ncbi:hypothetical protein ACQR16_11400 [Bradyrhizobium oligotrophicum]|uniref:hypothetical protein n=1 Tax=Bradyrhizobium oligotrophicum TaxID=44255 RepID=UPI003EB8C56D